MKTQTKVLILAAIAALAFLGAWLIPEPTLRPLDLASVRGGDPPPCTHGQLADTCDDFFNICKQESTQVDCEPKDPILCTGCTNAAMINHLDSSHSPRTVIGWSNPVEVDCGWGKTDRKCKWINGACKCFGTTVMIGCTTYKWGTLDTNCQ
jgi:hypothetical protein